MEEHRYLLILYSLELHFPHLKDQYPIEKNEIFDNFKSNTKSSFGELCVS